MQKLTILYDATCGLCFQAKLWMLGQNTMLQLEFLAAASPVARQRYPQYANDDPEELIAIDDRGGVYRGTKAWLICLWALEEYRDLSFRLASPRLQPMVRRAWRAISENRKKISQAFALAPEAELLQRLERIPEPIGCYRAGAKA